MVEYAGPHQLRRLLDAVVQIGSELSLPVLLERVLRAAIDLADATYGALGVLDITGTRLAEFIHVGFDDEIVDQIGRLPEGHGLLGLLIVDPQPIRLPDLHEHADSFGFPPGHPPMTAFLGVPIRVRGTVFGNLYLTDKKNGESFSDIDQELVVALAAAAGVAIENARLHEQVGEMAMVADRERIARDLHDTVIQRLFAIGLSLQAAARQAQAPEVIQRIDHAVDDVDSTIRDIRSVIFELHDSHAPGRGLRSAVLDLCTEATRPLGFEPMVRFDGPVDTLVTDLIGEHLLSTLRESLANVARHARATQVDIEVEARNGKVMLTVSDNGRGFDPATLDERGNGLINMENRAQKLGGSLDLGARENGSGSVLRWAVPLTAPG